MKKITKEMCTAYVMDFYRTYSVIPFILSFFLIMELWFFSKNAVVVTISAFLALFVSIFLVFAANKKIKNINSQEFFLVEDVVANVRKERGFGRTRAGDDYIYTFRHYGKHTIHKSFYPTIELPLLKKYEIDHLSVDKMCLDAYEKGVKYYLLVLKKKDRTRIVKCFPQCYFCILQEDFDFIDGRWYCKK